MKLNTLFLLCLLVSNSTFADDASLGLLLGGIGGDGTSNAALDQMNLNRQRQIQAQKDNLENAKMVFDAYSAAYRNGSITREEMKRHTDEYVSYVQSHPANGN